LRRGSNFDFTKVLSVGVIFNNDVLGLAFPEKDRGGLDGSVVQRGFVGFSNLVLEGTTQCNSRIILFCVVQSQEGVAFAF
jgi:hypothetical protein